MFVYFTSAHKELEAWIRIANDGPRPLVVEFWRRTVVDKRLIYDIMAQNVLPESHDGSFKLCA